MLCSRRLRCYALTLNGIPTEALDEHVRRAHLLRTHRRIQSLQPRLRNARLELAHRPRAPQQIVERSNDVAVPVHLRGLRCRGRVVCGDEFGQRLSDLPHRVDARVLGLSGRNLADGVERHPAAVR